MSDYKSICALWKENGYKPIDVQNECEKDNFFHVVGISPYAQAAGWWNDTGTVETESGSSEIWRLYAPPKPKVMRYPALIRYTLGPQQDRYIFHITNEVFQDIAAVQYRHPDEKVLKLLIDWGVECDD